MSSLELIRTNNLELVIEKKIVLENVKKPLSDSDLILKEAKIILAELDIDELGECSVFD